MSSATSGGGVRGRYGPTFELKSGDLRPTVTHIIRDGEGEPVDLSGATGVRFYLQHPDDDAPRVNASMDIVDTATGEVEYEWQEGDTSGVGRHYVEFVVQWDDGAGGVKPQTDPPSGYYYADFDTPIGRGDPSQFDGKADITVGHITADSGAFDTLTVGGESVVPGSVSEHDHTGDALNPADLTVGGSTLPDAADLPVAAFTAAGVTWWIGTEPTAEMAETDVFIDIS